MGEEQHHRLKHGYYCVQLPDDAERSRNLSRAEYQKLADDFFSSTSPWKDILHSQRFGIPNFVSNVSSLLVELIEAKYAALFCKVCRDERNAVNVIPMGHLHLVQLPVYLLHEVMEVYPRFRLDVWRQGFEEEINEHSLPTPNIAVHVESFW